MKTIKTFCYLATLLVIVACGEDEGVWWGGGDKEIPLPGKRLSLQSQKPQLMPDKTAKASEIILPVMPVNAAWPQAMGNGTGVSGNLSFVENPSVAVSAEIGEGIAFNSPLIPAPVVANGMVFAMDGAGHISGHHQTELQKIYWKSALLAQDEDEDEGTLLGGGLAWANGAIFAANDQGVVAALSGSDGKKRWLKELGLPLRSPPRVAGRYVLILTADNQLLCLMQSSGEMVWSHRGMSEMAGKLHDAPPVVRDGMVMVSYSSGETVALDLATGNPLWTENLAGSSQQADANQFSATSPLMATGLSFAASSQSLTALESETGRRLWERRVPVQTAPWLAGNYLFLQTPEAELLAIRGIDGVIPWITSLKAVADAQEINWYGPVVAAGRIWLSHDHGKLIAFNAKTGEKQQEVEIPSGVMTSPVIAEKAMYLIDSDANLHLLK